MKISRKTSAGQGLLVSLFIAALVLSACAPAVVGTNPDGYTVVGTNDSGKACKDRGGQTIALNNGSVVTCGGADNSTAPTPTDKQTTDVVGDAPSPDEAVGDAPSPEIVELKYDETGGTNLTSGQSKLIALYLRLKAPISQGALEGAVTKVQQEAVATKATVFEGTTLTLNQRAAWLVWCSDASQVDPPADVSLVHEVSLLDKKTLGRTWIQIPFAEGVPLRSDDSWVGCPAGFWAVAVK